MRNVDCHGSFYVILNGPTVVLCFWPWFSGLDDKVLGKSKELDPRPFIWFDWNFTAFCDSSFTCRCLGVVTKWCKMKKGTACITTKKSIQQYTSSWGCFITHFHGKLKMIYDILWYFMSVFIIIQFTWTTQRRAIHRTVFSRFLLLHIFSSWWLIDSPAWPLHRNGCVGSNAPKIRGQYKWLPHFFSCSHGFWYILILGWFIAPLRWVKNSLCSAVAFRIGSARRGLPQKPPGRRVEWRRNVLMFVAVAFAWSPASLGP